MRSYIRQVISSEIIISHRIEGENAKIISSSKFDIADILLSLGIDVIIKCKTNLYAIYFGERRGRRTERAIMEPRYALLLGYAVNSIFVG